MKEKGETITEETSKPQFNMDKINEDFNKRI